MATRVAPRFNVEEKVIFSTVTERPFVGVVKIVFTYAQIHRLKNYLVDLTNRTMEQLFSEMDGSNPDWRDEPLYLVEVEHYLDSQGDGCAPLKIIPNPGIAHFCSDSQLVEFLEC